MKKKKKKKKKKERDELLLILIKQVQQLKNKMELMETIQNETMPHKFEIANTNMLQVNRAYLNEETNIYEIFDDYLIENREKFNKFLEMCEDNNKLEFLVWYPMKDWIKKHNLLYINNNKLYIYKNKNGFVEMNIDELNSLSNYLFESLYKGLWKNYFGELWKNHFSPLITTALKYGLNQFLYDESNEIHSLMKIRKPSLFKSLHDSILIKHFSI